LTIGELSAAVKYLQSGEGKSAIVCGANVHCWYVLPFSRCVLLSLEKSLRPGTLGFLTAQKMTSVKGRCATFTNEADG